MKPECYEDPVHTWKKCTERVTFKLKFKLKSHPITNQSLSIFQNTFLTDV